MSDFAALDILLYEEKIGTLTHLPGDRNLFTFSQEYIDNLDRPTLSLSFNDRLRDLIIDQKSTRTRLPPFFANLLPEGHMREYLAAQANVKSEREVSSPRCARSRFAWALSVRPTSTGLLSGHELFSEEGIPLEEEHNVLRFSLAGVQLKFSAVWESERGLTIPVDGVGGGWIVKLPSPIYAAVPENEYTMMELARHIGINVPETSLVPIDQIKGLPIGINTVASYAFVIKRFDRDTAGHGIHIEDFAQVFGVFPEKKYKAESSQYCPSHMDGDGRKRC